MREMMNKQTLFDVKNLSSRKLWELLSTDECTGLSYQQQQLATRELLVRQHYLAQLETLPQLNALKQQPHYFLLQQSGIH
jgi:hypothetical protein